MVKGTSNEIGNDGIIYAFIHSFILQDKVGGIQVGRAQWEYVD